jgi:hypothetical protein
VTSTDGDVVAEPERGPVVRHSPRREGPRLVVDGRARERDDDLAEWQRIVCTLLLAVALLAGVSLLSEAAASAQLAMERRPIAYLEK